MRRRETRHDVETVVYEEPGQGAAIAAGRPGGERARGPARGSIAILDFGAQYAQLIARRVRELQVFCEIVPFSVSPEQLAAAQVKGIILTGGPASVLEPGAPLPHPGIYRLGVPVLGICYGMQLMAHQLGGRVVTGELREYGTATLEVRGGSPLFGEEAPPPRRVWMSHRDRIEQLPPGFQVLAATETTPVAAMADPERRLYGVQFHPEVAHTERGRELLGNFLFRVCGVTPDWTPRSIVEEAVERVRAQVGPGRALVALSGGVDSAVAAALVHRAIGSRLTGIFVDHGLLRRGEAGQVLDSLRRLGVPVVHVDARELFLARLAGVADPEEKRKRVGAAFIQVFEEEAARQGPVEFLVQGTVYPDVIESGSGHAHVIKSHHNVGGLPERMRLKLVEPLRHLFKDEVRRAGEALGLPEEVVWRHPFPGPGLAIRILGPVTEERLAALRAADAIVVEEVRRAGLYRKLWQAFAVLTDSRSVGVMGDARMYGYTVAIRAVVSEDGMTADWARLPHEVLERMATRIVNEVEGVNRVVYDITSKPPATIEWE